jgi:large subunit ribosomal protein L1
MNKQEILKAIDVAKTSSPKRKFKQSYDIIINLKNLDLKKNENHVDVFSQLHKPRGKKVKVCALVGPELKDSAKDKVDTVVPLDDFDKYAKDKKLTKKLANEHDFFIAQANIMPKVAAAFGKVLGPKNKMPNPKAGCVVPPNANLEALNKKLQDSIRISVKVSPLFQARIGNEDSPTEDLVDNAMDIYNSLVHALPNEQNNIKSCYLKLTMGPSVKIGSSTNEEKTEDKVPKYKKASKKTEEKKSKPKEDTKKVEEK